MNITLDISSTSLLFYSTHHKYISTSIHHELNGSELFTTSITATTTTTTVNKLLRLFNTTRLIPYVRPISAATTTAPSSTVKKYFSFQVRFNRIMRMVELFILSLTLPCYAIAFILFIELSVQHISSNTAISGGGSRTRTQRRRQRMRSLIWTSNYLLVDFLGLLYELIYVIIHLTGDLAIGSVAGRFYCQVQIYLPLYLTVLMAYSLTAISIYRRRHFINLNNDIGLSAKHSMLFIIALWIIPIITSILPAFLLMHFDILKIKRHDATNECQISYTYGSTAVALYMCYRLGNIFLLPLSISFVCYLTICIDLIRMQRRFSRAFKRHVHIRKNLILQILFLFLNFAVFWLPAEIITLYTKSRLLKDTVQVTKSLNILLDPLIITGFDTRFSSAAQQFLSKWRLDEFISLFGSTRQNTSSAASTQLMTTRAILKPKRSDQSTLETTSRKSVAPSVLRNVMNENLVDLESTPNHISVLNEPKSKANIDRKLRQSKIEQQRRRRSQQSESSYGRRGSATIVRQQSKQKRVNSRDTHRKETSEKWK